MAKKKEDTGEDQYKKELENNATMFREVIKQVRPDIFVLMDLLDKTGVNPYILFHVIRHMNSIVLGNKYGSVNITIEDGVVTFVRGEESTKLNEEVIRSKE